MQTIAWAGGHRNSHEWCIDQGAGERAERDAGMSLEPSIRLHPHRPAERLPVARELGETSLMVLVHPPITPEQMAGYAEAVRSVVKRACRWGGS